MIQEVSGLCPSLSIHTNHIKMTISGISIETGPWPLTFFIIRCGVKILIIVQMVQLLERLVQLTPLASLPLRLKILAKLFLKFTLSIEQE